MGRYLNKVKEIELSKPAAPSGKDLPHYSLNETMRIKETLRKQGVVAIQSQACGETIYFCQDEHAALLVPKGYSYFTLQELKNMVNINYSEEELRQLCLIKKQILDEYRIQHSNYMTERAAKMFNGQIISYE